MNDVAVGSQVRTYGKEVHHIWEIVLYLERLSGTASGGGVVTKTFCWLVRVRVGRGPGGLWSN